MLEWECGLTWGSGSPYEHRCVIGVEPDVPPQAHFHTCECGQRYAPCSGPPSVRRTLEQFTPEERRQLLDEIQAVFRRGL